MLRTGAEIENARRGQRKKFLVTVADSNGELLRTEDHSPPGPFEPAHVHPYQVSTAEVTSGSILFVVAGRQVRLGPGDRLEIPAGTPHTFRNEGPEEAHWIGDFRPALDAVLSGLRGVMWLEPVCNPPRADSAEPRRCYVAD